MKKLSKDEVKKWIKENGFKIVEGAFAGLGVAWTAVTIYNQIMYGEHSNVQAGTEVDRDEQIFGIVFTKRDRFGKLHQSTKEHITWSGDNAIEAAEHFSDLASQSAKILRGEQTDYTD